MLEAYLFIIDQLSKVWNTASSWYIFPGVNLLFASALLLILHVVITLFIPTGFLGLGNRLIVRADNDKFHEKMKAKRKAQRKAASKANNTSSRKKGG